MKYTETEKTAARKLQATLVAINQKMPIFFNTTLFQNLGLVRQFGKTIDNKTNWVLTEKAKMFLNVSL